MNCTPPISVFTSLNELFYGRTTSYKWQQLFDILNYQLIEMYNNKSDNSRCEPHYKIVMPNDPHKSNDRDWMHFLYKFAHSNGGNEQRCLLQDSPTISASTTATNLSSLENLPTKHNRRMGTLEENLRVAQPEIEPLQSIQTKDEKSPDTISQSSHSINVYNSTTVQKPQLFYQVLTALSVSMVSMAVGFVSAYTAPTTESLKLDFGVTDDEVSWVGGLMPLAALVGGLLGGVLIEFFGRKYTILLTDLLFMVSWVLIAVAFNMWFLYVGRCIAGFAVGIASLALPVYLGETIQPEVRGTLGLLPTAFGNIGILLCFTAGSYISWSNLAWLGFVIPLPFILLSFLIPETPRWYISKGREQQAHNSLQKLRGKDVDIQEEFDSLTKSHKESLQAPSYGLSELLKKANIKPLLISLGLMFFQQLSGINAVIFYTTDIFHMSGSTIDTNVCTIIVGVVNFVSTFIATVLIDRLGRKILLYVSSVAMIITLGTLGTYFFLAETGVDVKEYGWLPLISFVLYVLGFSLGFGPIPWLMLGELFPAKIRGSAASLATAFNWACTFIVTKTFLNIIKAIGPHGTFWLFAIVCVLALVFVILWVPETQGLSLQDIERKLAGLKVRRMSSVANLKPMPSTF